MSYALPHRESVLWSLFYTLRLDSANLASLYKQSAILKPMGFIRLLLAISVVLTHISPFFGFEQLNGETAVQAFFVISGFYMTLILREKYIGKNGSYFSYLSNRLLRIYPTYWVVLLATIVLSFILFQFGLHSAYDSYNTFYQEHSTHHSQFLYASPGNIIKDFTIVGRTDYAVLNDAVKNMTVPQAWTLVLELLFYLIAPFIVRKTTLIIPFLFASICLRYFVFHFALINHMPLPYRFFPSEIIFFLLGSLAYVFYKKAERMRLRRSAIFTIFILFVVFTLIYEYLPIDTKFRWLQLKVGRLNRPIFLDRFLGLLYLL
jgi:peptidoglycan/LPS O-acetylase OafA/YrhL